MLASGPVSRVIDKENLERLYGTPVEKVVAVDGDSSVFLPG